MLASCVRFLLFLQDFAFAEYENADSALRALRLLNNMDMGAGKLTLKCDTKTQSALQEHHRIKIQKVMSFSIALLLVCNATSGRQTVSFLQLLF